MTIIEFVPYTIALAIAAVIPGPGVTASVGAALGSGFRTAFLFSLGIVCGDITYLTFAVLGLTAIASAFSGFFTLVKFAGVAYLLYLAWSFWRGGVDPEKVKAKKARGGFSTFIGGWTLTLGNPKTIIFYMALLPTVIDLQTVTFERYLVLAALTAIVLIGVLVPYIGLAAKARDFLVNPNALKWLGRGAATAMAGAAAVILIRE